MVAYKLKARCVLKEVGCCLLFDYVRKMDQAAETTSQVPITIQMNLVRLSFLAVGVGPVNESIMTLPTISLNTITMTPNINATTALRVICMAIQIY